MMSTLPTRPLRATRKSVPRVPSPATVPSSHTLILTGVALLLSDHLSAATLYPPCDDVLTTPSLGAQFALGEEISIEPADLGVQGILVSEDRNLAYLLGGIQDEANQVLLWREAGDNYSTALRPAIPGTYLIEYNEVDQFTGRGRNCYVYFEVLNPCVEELALTIDNDSPNLHWELLSFVPSSRRPILTKDNSYNRINPIKLTNTSIESIQIHSIFQLFGNNRVFIGPVQASLPAVLAPGEQRVFYFEGRIDRPETYRDIEGTYIPMVIYSTDEVYPLSGFGIQAINVYKDTDSISETQDLFGPTPTPIPTPTPLPGATPSPSPTFIPTPTCLPVFYPQPPSITPSPTVVPPLGEGWILSQNFPQPDLKNERRLAVKREE